METDGLVFVEGHGRGWQHACVILAMAATGGAFGASSASFGRMFFSDELANFATLLLVPFGMLLAQNVVDRWTARRVGTASFRKDGRIEIRKGSEYHETWIADLEGYRDGSSDFVELVPKPGRRTATPALRSVPTVTEASRTRVLALLDERGVRRLD